MSDKMRWRYGETNPVLAAVDSSTVIEIGDLLYLASGKALPASSMTPKTTVVATQSSFSNAFVGVAMQRSENGSTSPIRVATTGVFEYDAPSTTYGLGDLVGIYESEAAAPIAPQMVAKVSSSSGAIGRVSRVESTATTSILVSIRSVIMNGSFV